VVEEIAYDEPNKHSQQSQLRRLSGGQRRGPWDLNRTPVAPPWRRDRGFEKAAKKYGRPFWASSDERASQNVRQAPLVRLTLNLPSAHLVLTRARGECW
jgi:hypothetical protein